MLDGQNGSAGSEEFIQPEIDPAGTAGGNDGLVEISAERTSGTEYATIEAEPDATEFVQPETAPRKRGRPRGTTNKARDKDVIKASLSGLEQILLSSHAMLAAITGHEEIALDNDEAKNLAVAAARVSELYGTVIDPKTAALIALATTAGGIYAPRFFLIRMKRKAAKEKEPPVVPASPQAPSDLSAAGTIWSGIKP